MKYYNYTPTAIASRTYFRITYNFMTALNCADCQPTFLLKEKAYQIIRLCLSVGPPFQSANQLIDSHEISYEHIPLETIPARLCFTFLQPVTYVQSFETGATEKLCQYIKYRMI